MAVVFVVTYKDGFNCGVEDYTHKLCAALSQTGYGAKVHRMSTWSFVNLCHLVKSYLKSSDCLNIQYPAAGMGKSPIVSVMPLIFNPSMLFLTLHEFHIFSLIRKLFLLPYAYTSCTVIFSNAYEKLKFEQFYPKSRCRKSIIPIGSNIEVANFKRRGNEDKHKLIYFGQISPNKGIEHFIDVISILRDNGVSEPATIIGSVEDRAGEFYSFVSTEAKKSHINIIENASSDVVSETLNSASIAVLPYPDGVSEKRGTALACLDHGLVLITTQSEKTPEWLVKSTLKFTDPKMAALYVMAIIRGSNEHESLHAHAAEALANTKWPAIANLFIALYSTR